MIELYLQLLQQQQEIFGDPNHEYYKVETTKERKREIRGPFEEARKTICKEVQKALDGVFRGKFFVTFNTAHPHLRLPSIQCLYIYSTKLPRRARSGQTGGPYVRVFSPDAPVPNGPPMVSFRVAAGMQMDHPEHLPPFYNKIHAVLEDGAVQLAPEGYVEINGGTFQEFANWVAHPNEQGVAGKVVNAYNNDLQPDLVAALYTVMPQGAVENFIQPPVAQPPPEPDIDFSFPLQANSSRNAILYGPPGTGKTYATVSVAAQLIAGNQDQPQSWKMLKDKAANEKRNERENSRDLFGKALGKRIRFVTFHQSYSYEDFIGGLRPEVGAETLRFKWAPGIFLRACAAAWRAAVSVDWNADVGDDDAESFLQACRSQQEASEEERPFQPDREYPPVILVIDEINRANMSRVFGELITLLEEDKRLGGKEQLIVQLPNRPDCKFGVPKNLIIIGTMNTADKSLALLDLALRRRFEFVRLDPMEGEKFEELAKGAIEPRPCESVVKGLGAFLTSINSEIAARKKSYDFGIGHSYALEVCRADFAAPKDAIQEMLQRKVFPLLEEYFGGNHKQVAEVLNKALKASGFNERVQMKADLINLPIELTIARADQPGAADPQQP